MKIEYREELPDPEEYLQLFESTGWNEEMPLDSMQLMTVLETSWYTLSAYNDQNLVGFGRVLSDGILDAVIYDLIVHPDFQKKGIGSALLSRIVQHCKDQQVRYIQLFCAEGKISFYEKAGFSVRPEDAPGMKFTGCIS